MADSDTPTPAPLAQEPTPVPTPQPPRRKGLDRTVIGLSVLVQLSVVFLMVLMVNIVSYRHFKRWDLSHNQNYDLSPKTKNLLKSLDQQVKAIVFFPQAQVLTKDVYSVLREYEYASDKKFSVEYVDPYKNLTRARELSEKYKFGSSDNIVILDYKGKSKFVNAVDMAEIDNSGAMMGQPPTMKAFKGEEAITSALQGLVEDKENKLYLLTGHGEPTLEGDEIRAFKAYTERENIKLASLSLNNVDAVPADATGLLIFGAKTDLSERELELVGNFWTQKKGRLMILLNAAAKAPRLAEWMTTQGVTPQNDRVLKVGTGLVMENGQPSLKSNVIVASPTGSYSKESASIIKDLAGVETQLMGATESLLVDSKRAQAEKIKVTPLLTSGEGFWGETEYVQGENRNLFFDPKKDYMGPLTLGVAIEKGGLDDARVKVDTSRMIVIGNSGFLTDKGLQVSETGIDFALLSLNWMFNREAVSGIPPKPKNAMTLALDDKMISKIFYFTVVAIPAVAGLFGLYVAWFRASRNLLQLTLWLLGVGLFLFGSFWMLNLWVTSHELGETPFGLNAYLIPIVLVVVPLIGFGLNLARTTTEPQLANK